MVMKRLARMGAVWSTALGLMACDVLVPGEPDAAHIFDAPIDGLTPAQTRLFVMGDEEFSRSFSFSEGLGPIFNAPSCDSCHPGEGPGHPEFGFFRFGRYDAEGRFDAMLNEGGPQLQDRAIPGYEPEVLPARDDIVFTRLLAPSITGLGLLESVDDATLLALADPEDEDGDGISGRIAWIEATDRLDAMAGLAERGGGTRIQRHDRGYIGRFGLKASSITLLHQTVTAYHQDMGLTSDFARVDPINVQVGDASADLVPDPELGSGTLTAVTHYLRTLRPPLRRNVDDPDVVAGEAIFETIACASCHVPSLTTGTSTIAALSEVAFAPYTDLLLHDMGPELDDGYTEGGAQSREWRTAPLWGLGLAADFQGGQGFYLHDGRARSVHEAIEHHGGEAAASRQRYRELSATERAQILAFLESL
ncbi:thiol oxidoreductase [Bradymonadaceae bacterium TMQ3]|nr:thiol oxidoreductase [Bradymonadaceae bacterium TMQ3]TXC77635.1 thiol oxidoreductase [Bradymonadales bacterium TMQ1]